MSHKHRFASFAVILVSTLGTAFGCTEGPDAANVDDTATTSDTGTATGTGSTTSADDTAMTSAPDTETGKGPTDGPGTDKGSDQPSDSGSDTVVAPQEPMPVAAKAAWTIMLYEDADNNLESVMLDDVNETEKANLPGDVNVIVLLDRARGYDVSDGNWTGAKLFRMNHDDTPKKILSERLRDPAFLGLRDDSKNGEEINMASADTLKKFVEFAQEQFPAENYILHLSDHGDGWRKTSTTPEPGKIVRGICQDDSAGPMSSISVSEGLPTALAGKHFEAITFDACVMGNVEVAWALHPFADYLGVSVMNVPDTGFDYTATLERWLTSRTGEGWAATSVEEFRTFYEGSKQVGFTAVDLQAMPAFGEALEAFLAAAESVDGNAFKTIRNQAYRPDAFLEAAMRDFADLVARFEGSVPEDKLQTLLAAYRATIKSHWYSSDVAKIQGLSIYAPGPGLFQGGPYSADYDKTPFARDTQWDEFITSRFKTTPVPADTDTQDTDTASAK